MDGGQAGAFEPSPTVFGAGIKRKRIDFIPATDGAKSNGHQGPRRIGEKYLSIVLKDRSSQHDGRVDKDSEPVIAHETPTESSCLDGEALCEICKMPIIVEKPEAVATTPHDLSLAHQVCVQHSFPPSHLDRNRQGLKYLSSYGWDVDSRKGLGASGEGRRAPVRATVKNNTVGLGMEIPHGQKRVERIQLLDAGKVRKLDDQEKQRRIKLHEMFYQSEDIERYLGGA